MKKLYMKKLYTKKLYINKSYNKIIIIKKFY